MQSLTRENLDQQEAIEALAERLGPAFAGLVSALVERYPLDQEEEVIRLRLALPGVIGLKAATYQALLKAALRCVEREPGFATRLATRHNDEQACSIPHGLWLDIYHRAARGDQVCS